MTEGFFAHLSITDFHGDMHRNIVSLRESQDLFDDLTASVEGKQAAMELEIATKPHTFISNQPIIHRPFEEAAYQEAIRYPFENWAKTRYSDGAYGVWYGADTLATSVHETAYHWRRNLLEDAGWYELEGVIQERKIYLIRCDAALFNFAEKIHDFPALIDPQSYHFTQQLGARIHHEGHPGLISCSARCQGEVYAVFNPRVLTNPRQLCYLTYRTQAGAVVVERQLGEVILHMPIL